MQFDSATEYYLQQQQNNNNNIIGIYRFVLFSHDFPDYALFFFPFYFYGGINLIFGLIFLFV